MFSLKRAITLACEVFDRGQLFTTSTQRGWLAHPRGLPHRRSIRPSGPAYNTTAGSSICGASDATVVFTIHLSRVGLYKHTGPHLYAWAVYWIWASHCLGSPVFFQQIGGELSCIISRRLHWMVQWAGAQVAATTVWLTSNRQLEGTIGRVADTAHTGSFITRRSHLNLLWIHIALSTPMIYPLCYGQYGESQSQLLESSWDSGAMIWLGSIGRFQCIQELRVIGGKNNPVPEATAILVKSLKAVRKFPA